MQALQNNTMEAITLYNKQQKNFLESQAALLTLKDDRRKILAVDKDMIDIFLLMDKKQINSSN